MSSSLGIECDSEEAQDEDQVSFETIEETQEEDTPPKKNYKNWEVPETPFQNLVLMVGEAKWFQAGEKKRLKFIEERKNYEYDESDGDNAFYPAFVKTIIDWGIEKNRNGVVITVAKLIIALENNDRFISFVAAQKQKQAAKENNRNRKNRSKRGLL
jgi:hypothetical protein